jgi:hypothetical protein
MSIFVDRIPSEIRFGVKEVLNKQVVVVPQKRKARKNGGSEAFDRLCSDNQIRCLIVSVVGSFIRR